MSIWRGLSLLDLFIWASVLLSGVESQVAGPNHFFFQWPITVTQCQLINLTWVNAVPPFQAWVIPIGGQPFIYNIPANAQNDRGFGSYQILLQLNQGVNYVMLMNDARGMGTGGTSEIQIVASSPRTDCLNTAAQNQTAKQFSYSVAGQARQCQPGFELQWDSSSSYAPYNFTVVPLDQGYYPFDVAIDDVSGYTSDWRVNMTAGSRFTVVMNNKNGYGYGGAAGIYEVANGTNSGCIQQSGNAATGSWPVGVATNTLPVATNPPQRPPGSATPLGGGAIAGIVIGVLVLLALGAALVWFLLRRKRRQEERVAMAQKDTDLDLSDSRSNMDDGGYGNFAPAVSPFPRDGRYSAVPTMERSGSWTGEGGGEGEGSESGRGTSAGFAGFAPVAAAGAGASSSQRSPGQDRERDSWNIDSRTLTDEGEDRTGPGVAGPLPSKSHRGSHISSRSNHTPPRLPSAPPSQSQSKSDYPPLPPGASYGHRPSSADNSAPAAGPATSGGMRIVNHDNPDELPAVPQIPAVTAERERDRRQRASRTEFRRHEDAGRVDIVDLPPLYTDVPRDGTTLESGPPPEDEGRATRVDAHSREIHRGWADAA